MPQPEINLSSDLRSAFPDTSTQQKSAPSIKEDADQIRTAAGLQ